MDVLGPRHVKTWSAAWLPILHITCTIVYRHMHKLKFQISIESLNLNIEVRENIKGELSSKRRNCGV